MGFFLTTHYESSQDSDNVEQQFSTWRYGQAYYGLVGKTRPILTT